MLFGYNPAHCFSGSLTIPTTGQHFILFDEYGLRISFRVILAEF